ncbi:MAG: hypothetical protein HY518_02325 [Candidatus Aenigmarchaeota archaeon]|nr:hypothetical protein [Candidatus Aenigmarchaeota archaeon]
MKKIIGGVGEIDLIEVPGISVEDGALGFTDFDTGTPRIRVADFSPVYESADPSEKGYLKSVAEYLKQYVFGHELMVECLMRPRNEDEHALHEAGYVSHLRSGRGSQDGLMKYAAALISHSYRGDSFGSTVKQYLRDAHKIDFDEDLRSIEKDLGERGYRAFSRAIGRLLGMYKGPISESPLPSMEDLARAEYVTISAQRKGLFKRGEELFNLDV